MEVKYHPENCDCLECRIGFLEARVAELESALRESNDETKLYPGHKGRYAHLLH